MPSREYLVNSLTDSPEISTLARGGARRFRARSASFVSIHRLLVLCIVLFLPLHILSRIVPHEDSPRSQQNLQWLRHRTKARRHAINGELERARQSYNDLLRTKKASLSTSATSGLHVELGTVLMKLGDNAGARYNFLEAQSFLPQSHTPHMHLAALESRLANIDLAITHYKHALFYNATDTTTDSSTVSKKY